MENTEAESEQRSQVRPFSLPLASEAWPRISWQIGTLLLVTSAFALLFTWALLNHHRAFNSNGWDLGWFDQIVWNSSQGRFFENSFAPWNFLGEHIEPVLLLYALVYRVWPNVEILLVSQAIVGASGALILFAAARVTLQSSTAALLVAVAFLLAPEFQNAMLFDFHPEVMAVVSIFGAFAFLASGRPNLALAATATAFLFKEDASLVAIGIGWLFWLYGYRRRAIGIVAVALIYFVLVTAYVMPHVRGGAGGPQNRWSYLGSSGPEIVVGTVQHPDLVVEQLAKPGPRGAVLTLLTSQGLLPLASPAGLAAAPLSLAHLLSTHESESRLHLHYGVLPVALVFVGTTLGIASLSRREFLWRRLKLEPANRVAVLAGVVFTAELVFALFTGPFGVRFNPSHFEVTAHDAIVASSLKLIPQEASVAAQSGIVPHVSQRERVWEFPPAFGAEYVIVDNYSWWQTHGPYSPERDYELAKAALPHSGYCLIFDTDGLQIWQLGGCDTWTSELR